MQQTDKTLEYIQTHDQTLFVKAQSYLSTEITASCLSTYYVYIHIHNKAHYLCRLDNLF